MEEKIDKMNQNSFNTDQYSAADTEPGDDTKQNYSINKDASRGKFDSSIPACSDLNQIIVF